MPKSSDKKLPPTFSNVSEIIHSFVDEAGDPTLFGRKRESASIVGEEGCSKFFMMGKLEVADPEAFSQKFKELHTELLSDPYFAGVESFKEERRKTYLGFHAKNDLPEVRYLVFKFLKECQGDLRFHAVIADKTVIARREMARREEDPKARYDDNSLYDGLIRELYGKFHRIADEYEVCIARRGQKDRNESLLGALEKAEEDFASKFGFGRESKWALKISDPHQTNCLQAVDYFLWALQRFYERQEPRFLEMMWPQMGEVHDLHHGPSGGTFFSGEKMPTTETVFPRRHEPKIKKPRI